MGSLRHPSGSASPQLPVPGRLRGCRRDSTVNQLLVDLVGRPKFDDIVLELNKEHFLLLLAQENNLAVHLDFAINFAMENHVEEVAFTVIVEDHRVLRNHQGLHDFANLLKVRPILHGLCLIGGLLSACCL